MNLRDLHYCVVLARLRHFGDAAKHCCVSQPTLSMQIKKLEEELGVVLFERNNKQVMLTEKGRLLVEKAQVILDEATQLKNLALTLSDPFSGELRLGVIPTLSPYLLPLMMPAIQDAFPALRVWLIEDKTKNLIEKLATGSIDAAIMAAPVAGDFYEEVLFDEPFYFACAPDHPLSKQKNIQVEQLNNQPMLLLEEGHCLRDQAMEVCHLAKAETSADLTATSLETLRLMVHAGLGVTLLPALAKETTHAQELVLIPFSNPKPFRQIAFFWRPNTAKWQCLQAIAELTQSLVVAILKRQDDES